MAATEVPNRRESRKAMEEKMTTARRVIRQVASGRPPADKTPGIVEALYLGRAMANKLTEAAVAAGLAHDDTGCFLISSDPDSEQPGIGQFWPVEQDSKDLEMGREISRSGARPVGIVLFVYDHEVKGMRAHGRAFERTEQSERLVDAALELIEKLYGL